MNESARLTARRRDLDMRLLRIDGAYQGGAKRSEADQAKYEQLRAEAERIDDQLDSMPVPTSIQFDMGPIDLHAVPMGRENAGFETGKDFLQAVMAAGTKAGMDDRLVPLRAAAGSDEQSGFSDPYGGFVVPTAYQPNVLTRGTYADPLTSYTTKVPAASSVVKIPARVDSDHSTSASGGLRMYRKAESDTVSSSRMTFEQITLEATTLFGVTFVTEELLADSAPAFSLLLEQSFKDEYASERMRERLNGTGAGEPLGVNNSGCLLTVDKEVGQAATTLVFENIVKMRARCWGYESAVWLASPTCIPQLAAMTVSAGTAGQAIYYFNASENDVPDKLMGRPLVFTEHASALGTAGDIVLGSWGQYLELEREGLRGADSIHVRFVEHERAFKFWTRGDGRPWWTSAMTPRAGDTLSPFVRLATRS